MAEGRCGAAEGGGRAGGGVVLGTIVPPTSSPSSFLVEKQPPQVLKTQTKFQASVRFLLGPQLLKASPKPYTVRADMVTEKQARELALSTYSNTLR